MNAQLLFPFIEKTETDYLREEMAEVRINSDKALAMADNVRKGIFKRHTELSKLYLEQREEIDLLKAQMEIMKKAIK